MLMTSLSFFEHVCRIRTRLPNDFFEHEHLCRTSKASTDVNANTGTTDFRWFDDFAMFFPQHLCITPWDGHPHSPWKKYKK